MYRIEMKLGNHNGYLHQFIMEIRENQERVNIDLQSSNEGLSFYLTYAESLSVFLQFYRIFIQI